MKLPRIKWPWAKKAPVPPPIHPGFAMQDLPPYQRIDLTDSKAILRMMPDPREAMRGAAHPHDAIHQQLKESFFQSLQTERQNPINPNIRYKITFLCGRCDVLHSLTGNTFQCVETLMVFLQTGYPVVQVMELGLEEVAAIDGLDMSTEEGLRAAAESYKEFLAKTGR